VSFIENIALALKHKASNNILDILYNLLNEFNTLSTSFDFNDRSS
jgi:hypothetical protein